MQTLDHDQVTIHVDAPPEDVYALVADITRMPEFSPEITRCAWLDGATGPAVGARFEAVNIATSGKTWKNRPVITRVRSGREIGWARTEPFAGTVAWSYRFEPEDGGTRVTEAYDVERPVTRVGWFVIEKVFRSGHRRTELRAGMHTTLERLRAVAEQRPADTHIAGADSPNPLPTVH